eukprot:4101652-Alexandrium_andersonii.AAC.1
MVALCFMVGLIDMYPLYASVEYFAGQQPVSRAMRGRGYDAFAYELDIDNLTHDILSGPGYIHA